MEIFALSHEYSHFVAHERELKFKDEDGNPFPQGLELFCDAMGLQISRIWGSKNRNWLAFTGVGGASLSSVQLIFVNREQPNYLRVASDYLYVVFENVGSRKAIHIRQ